MTNIEVDLFWEGFDEITSLRLSTLRVFLVDLKKNATNLARILNSVLRLTNLSNRLELSLLGVIIT